MRWHILFVAPWVPHSTGTTFQIICFFCSPSPGGVEMIQVPVPDQAIEKIKNLKSQWQGGSVNVAKPGVSRAMDLELVCSELRPCKNR